MADANKKPAPRAINNDSGTVRKIISFLHHFRSSGCWFNISLYERFILQIYVSVQVQQAVNKKDQYLTAKSDIHINNFDLMYGEKKLLMDASLTINYGHRL